MGRGSYRRRRYGAVLLILLATLSIQFVYPETALAHHRSYLGRQITVDNYGVAARIGTTNPYVQSGHASWELIRSATYSMSTNRMVQIGWGKGTVCGGAPGPRVFWEYYNPQLSGNGGYRNGCFTGSNPHGDNDYYIESNGSYWCYGFNGQCVQTVYSSTVGLYDATLITAYGETTHTSSNVEMGGAGSSNAIYFSNIKYKPTASATPSQWNYVTTAGGSYVPCPESPCPYGMGFNFAATVLYVYNWTSGY